MNRAPYATIRTVAAPTRATPLGVGLALLDVRLRLLSGLRPTLRQLDVERRDAPLEAAEAERLALRVDGLLAQLPFAGRRPLARTLTLFRLLRRRGVPLEVHVGVRDEGSALLGRCWLSHQGRPLFEADDPAKRFAGVYRYCSRSDRQMQLPIEVVDGAGEAVLDAWRTISWGTAG